MNKQNFFLFTIAAVSFSLMVACGSKKSTADSDADDEDTELVDDDEDDDSLDDVADGDDIATAPDELWTEEAVADMLRRAYDDVSVVFTPQETEPNIDLDFMYCTKEFGETLRQVRVVDYRTGKSSAFEAMHWNPWMEGEVHPDDIDVTLLTGDMAEATYNLKNANGEWIHMRVSVYFEDGSWRINDWLEVGDSNSSLMEDMKYYIEENGGADD